MNFSIRGLDPISPNQALSMIRKRLDDISEKFNGKLYSPDMKKLKLKVVPSFFIKSQAPFRGSP